MSTGLYKAILESYYPSAAGGYLVVLEHTETKHLMIVDRWAYDSGRGNDYTPYHRQGAKMLQELRELEEKRQAERMSIYDDVMRRMD